MKIRALAAALGLTVSIVAPPAGAGVQIIGPGIDSCGTWTADRAAHGVAELSDKGWVGGFLGGVAVSGVADPLNGTDAEAVWAWMDNYRRAHPLVKIIDAAVALIQQHPAH